ncbi:hypothetical protein HELRODRAFT_96179 [Helobdella robusta]|uniref:RNA helicase n=1 Tax=Helobdella robusta TaxID=6412 RepID=T1G9A5_HELRO|nr:hypothetical protein HELRODRAFT_96179 [Helobdella robusta]ESN93083.1 hypothetical protein HELRODRAFT_96179 [Helobdella robusta]
MEVSKEAITSVGEDVTFESLGVTDVLCEACQRLKWSKPTPIQKETIPVALSGKDIIGLAETGSGKTGAFAIPILQDLLQKQSRLFALVLAPTRELAFQISETFDSLGRGIKLKLGLLIGGVNKEAQSKRLASRPHILIATPGRLLEHLRGTTGFNLKYLKYLVLDEADRMLEMNFGEEIGMILSMIPEERKTYLFSATMTKTVNKLKKACMKDPVKIEVSKMNQAASKVIQYHIFCPEREKELYLFYLVQQMRGNSMMIFTNSCGKVWLFTKLLRTYDFSVHQIHGKMTQKRRLESLKKFREDEHSILVGTSVASRGLDIAHVDIIIIYDLPEAAKDYIHRVGRTARAGKYGKSYTFVTQNNVREYLEIEKLLGYQIPRYEPKEEDVLRLEADYNKNRDDIKVMQNRVDKMRRKQRKEHYKAEGFKMVSQTRNKFKKKK